MAWSYRDLVYLRVLAWLRLQGIARPEAAQRVAALKAQVSAGRDIREVRADGTAVTVDDDVTAPLGGQAVLFVNMLGSFNLVTAGVEEFEQRTLWGPDLVKPSEHTYISPWVLAGDPCVDNTRIPTAAIFALRQERGLDVTDVIALYPDLADETVEEATALERRLHGLDDIAA